MTRREQVAWAVADDISRFSLASTLLESAHDSTRAQHTPPPGVSNKADHLSRRLDYDEGKGDNEDIRVLPDTLFANAILSLDVEQAVYN
jgi:hypothetical protein